MMTVPVIVAGVDLTGVDLTGVDLTGGRHDQHTATTGATSDDATTGAWRKCR